MIHIEIYTHVNVSDSSICFEEGDLRVSFILNDVLTREDFDRLWESVCEIETDDMIPEEWYEILFERKWVDDGSGGYNLCWFELINSKILKI